MSKSKQHDRNRRIARSHGAERRMIGNRINGKRTTLIAEHAQAQESRDQQATKFALTSTADPEKLLTPFLFL